MVPPFDDYGNLPSGIHFCTIQELKSRFGTGSEIRESAFSELSLFVQTAIRLGIRRILVNGSFVTGKLEPNDIDVVILPGVEYPREKELIDSEAYVWPYLQIILAADDEDFESWATRQFATDRQRRSKGVVELLL